MSAAFGAGYSESAGDIRSAISNFARQELQLNLAIGGFARWLSQLNVTPQGASITLLEQAYLDDYNQRRPNDATNAANAHADYLEALNWLKLTTRDLQYATTQAGAGGIGTTTVSDNTTGTQPVTLTVAVGAKGYVTADPTLISLHDGVGVDTSPVINQVAPPQF